MSDLDETVNETVTIANALAAVMRASSSPAVAMSAATVAVAQVMALSTDNNKSLVDRAAYFAEGLAIAVQDPWITDQLEQTDAIQAD